MSAQCHNAGFWGKFYISHGFMGKKNSYSYEIQCFAYTNLNLFLPLHLCFSLTVWPVVVLPPEGLNNCLVPGFCTQGLVGDVGVGKRRVKCVRACPFVLSPLPDLDHGISNQPQPMQKSLHRQKRKRQKKSAQSDLQYMKQRSQNSLWLHVILSGPTMLLLTTATDKQWCSSNMFW